MHACIVHTIDVWYTCTYQTSVYKTCRAHGYKHVLFALICAVSMASRKRLRSLPSVLWETDCDPEESRQEWFGQPACLKRIAVPETPLQLNEKGLLLQENSKLRSVITGMQRQLNLLGSSGGYRTEASQKRPAVRSTTHLDPWHWLQTLSPDVAQMPRMVEEVIPALETTKFCNGAIQFQIFSGDSAASASTLLSHCQSIIESIYSRHPAIFKIGLTKSSVPRWSNPVYGYAHDKFERWTGMRLLFLDKEALPAGLVESALIQYFKSVPGCRNDNPGGEGVDASCPGPYFVYVVYHVLTPPKRISA